MKRYRSWHRQIAAVALFLLTVTASSSFVADHGPGPAPLSWGNKPLVSTKFGLIRGKSDKGSTWTWKGIPYASPPVGLLRWKAPVDPEPWGGILKTINFAKSASQILPVLGPFGSEDCLYLNIWRPKGSQTNLPVYLFIHGGGNTIGTAASPEYCGNAVAGKSGMVFITVTYRLGVMGWFRHPAVTDSGSPLDQSGNFGTLDLIKALEWIHENSTAFGGDPGNVTISGESAGAMNVLSLLTSPVAKGLFHKAVVESGLTLIRSASDGEVSTKGLLNSLLLADGKARTQEEASAVAAQMKTDDIDAYFRSKSAHQLMKWIKTTVGGMAEWPTLYTDGAVIPTEGYDVFSTGTWCNKVPLIIGVNKDEMNLFRFMLRDPKPGSGEYKMLSKYQSLLWRYNGLDQVASTMTSHAESPPVYCYRFDWGSPDAGGKSVLPGDLGAIIGSCHYSEVPFFLGMGINQLAAIMGVTYTRQNRHGREKLTDACLTYLANFARSGNPNGSGLPQWSPWNPSPGKEKILILDAGLTDLRISASNERVTLNSIREQARSELIGAQLQEVLNILRSTSPIRIGN